MHLPAFRTHPMTERLMKFFRTAFFKMITDGQMLSICQQVVL